MTKQLVGSLVVAPMELPAQALPASQRERILAARANGGLSPLMPHVASAIVRSKLGSLIRPVGHPDFIAHSVLESGGRMTVSGKTAAGKDVSITITDPRTDLMPKWASRIATFMRVAMDSPWDTIIKTLIAQHQLPVDPGINWSIVLDNMFKRHGLSSDADREDAIAQALTTIFVVRDSLSKYDPTKGSEATQDLPPDKRLTSYILQLFKWQLTGKDEAGDMAHNVLKNELTVLDAPQGEDDSEALTMADAITDETTPESVALHEAEIHSYSEFRAAFINYVSKHQPPNITAQVPILLDILAVSDKGSEIKAAWAERTGTTYTNQRRILSAIREELLHFVQSRMAPDTKLTRLINELRLRTMDAETATETADEMDEVEQDEAVAGGTKAKPMTTPVVAVASSLTLAGADATPERKFMATLTAAIRQIALSGKTAAPKVVEHSILYFRMSGDPSDPRYMTLSFYSPKLRINPGSGTYRIEVGDWDTDKSLPQARIKQQLSNFVIPMMRGDVLDEDHDLLEKVIRQLRTIVWNNAVEYFQVPTAEKATWKNIVKMDLQRIQDAKVTVRDEAHGVVEVAASLRESTKGRLAHRLAACSSCEEDDGDDRWTAARPRPRWNEEKQTWESTDDGQRGGLLGGQPADYGSKRQISLQASPGGYRHTHSDIKWPQAQPGDTVYFGDTVLGMGGSRGTIKSIRSDRRFLVIVPGQDQPVVVGEDRVTKLVPAKRAADANGHAPESTPAEASAARKAGGAAFDPDLHEGDAEPSITYMAKHLEASGIDPTSDNMHEAVEGFTTARDAHHKEASVTTSAKFANLQRIAAENPDAMAEAITKIEDSLREQLNNLSILKENFGITAPVGEVKEGEPSEVKEVEGAERLAGFKRIANDAPEAIEEALGEFYLAMDEIMAQTENLADNLDIDLPAGDEIPVEVEDPGNPDEGLHGEMPTGGDDTPEPDKADGE